LAAFRLPASHIPEHGCWAMLGDTKNARLYRRKVRAIYPDFDVDKWLSVVPFKEQWQKEQYREALRGPVSEIWFRTAGKSCHARVTRVLP
jgi:hypothetical protein